MATANSTHKSSDLSTGKAGREALTVVNQPKLASVTSIQERHKRSVCNELRRLLARVEAGEIIGIGYVTFAADNKISAMLAGVAARNRLAAAGAMMNVAMATAYEACDDGE